MDISKNKLVANKRAIESAIATNKVIIRWDRSPHERDMARCRIKILKNKLKTLEAMINV